MSTAEWIEFGTLFVLAVTLVAVYGQYRLQCRLLRAQLLRDRFSMYWKMYEPMPADALQWMDVCPEDYMPMDLYIKEYRDDPKARWKYAGMAQTYEFLAFSDQMRRLGLQDVNSHEWIRRWVSDLTGQREFMRVNDYYGTSYPDFAAMVRREAEKRDVGLAPAESNAET